MRRRRGHAATPGGDTGAPETTHNPVPREHYHTDWVADRTVAWLDSLDAGEHWFLAVRGPNPAPGAEARAPDPRPLGRIGGGDLPTIAVDPKNENVVYSSSTVLWRTEDGGMTWTAVRGAPGGDDYQKTWINPVNPDILLAVSDQGGVVHGVLVALAGWPLAVRVLEPLAARLTRSPLRPLAFARDTS